MVRQRLSATLIGVRAGSREAEMRSCRLMSSPRGGSISTQTVNLFSDSLWQDELKRRSAAIHPRAGAEISVTTIEDVERFFSSQR